MVTIPTHKLTQKSIYTYIYIYIYTYLYVFTPPKNYKIKCNGIKAIKKK